MNYYTLNVDALRKRYNALASKIEKTSELSDDIEVLYSKSNVPIIKYKDKLLHSRYNPIDEARRWVEANSEAIDNKRNGLIIIGLGLGYHIEEIIKRNENKDILIIEPSLSIFKSACRIRDLTNIVSNKNITLSVGEDEKQIESKMLYFCSEGLIQSIDLVSLPSYESLFNRYFYKISKILKDTLNSKILNINTIIYFAKTWPTNFFKNLKYVVQSTEFSKLYNKFSNKPGILISAGPSLNKNVNLLKEIKGKAFILCVDTALRVLYKEGIRPDAVIAVDGSDLNYKHLQGMDYDDIPLIYFPEVNYNILKEHKGHKIVTNVRTNMTEWIQQYLNADIGYIDYSGPSVSNIGFQVLKKIGCNPLILVGQDLAFTDNKSHADGTALKRENVDKTIVGMNKIMVEDIYGNQVLTSRSLYQIMKTFENLIQIYGGLIIDATEGGAKIKGTEIMTLMEAIEKYCKENIGVQDILKEVLNKEVQVEKVRKLIINMKDIVKGLNKVEKLGGKGIKKSQQLIKLYEKKQTNDKSINEILDSLDKIDKKIKKEADMLTFINMIIQPVMLQVMKGEYSIEPENETEIEKGIRIGKRSELLYKGISEVSKYMVDLINETIEEIENKFLN
jgi:hypothetical protein